MTGQPAFGDLPQGQLVEKIVSGSIARPRQLNEAIPRDLETIVLKAIAREPKDRYQSACALAIDLRLFLDDVPPLARRTTAVEHVWRWCRRNRLVASLAATALALLVLVLVSITAGYVLTSKALTRAEEQREKADAAREEAEIQSNNAIAERRRAEQQREKADAARQVAVVERNKAEAERQKAERQREKADAARQEAEQATELGLQVLDGIYERFAPKFDAVTMMTGPGSDADASVRPVLSQDTAEMLEEMLAFYDRLASHSSDDGRVQRKRAQASRRVGDIRKHLHEFDEAVDAYQRAISIYSKLDNTVDDPTVTLERGRIQNELGRVYAMTERPEQSRRSHLDAAKILETASSPDSDPDVRYELARTYYFLAEPQRWDTIGPPPRGPTNRPEGPPKPDDALSKPDFAPRPFFGASPPPDDRALPMGRGMGFPPPKPSDMGFPPPRRSGLGGMLPKPSDRGFAPPKPSDTERGLGLPPRRRNGDNNASEAEVRQWALYLNKAVDLLAEPGADVPGDSKQAVFLAFIYRALGTLHGRAKQSATAAENYQKAISIESALVKRLPDVASHREILGRLQQQLAMVLFQAGEPVEARRLLENSVKVLQNLLQTDSSMVSVNRPLAETYDCLAEVYLELGEDRLAGQSRKDADQCRRLAPPDLPGHPGAKPGLGKQHPRRPAAP